MFRFFSLLLFVASITAQPSWSYTSNNTQAVQLMVGYAPGGLADKLSRLAAAQLAKEISRPIIVKNLSGANGIRASLEVLQNTDGSAVLLFADSSLIIAHQTTGAPAPQLFMPVGTMGYTPFAIAVPMTSPFTSLPQLINFIRQNPDKSNYGSPGIASVHQLGVEMLLQRTEAKAQHIPYQGGGLMLSDLLQQRLTFGVVSIQLAQQYSRQQQLRVLAVTGPSRSPQMPDAPTVSEMYPMLSTISTAYLLATPNIEPSLYQSIISAWRRIIGNTELSKKFEEAGMEGGMRNETDTTLLIRQESERWRQALQQTHIN